MRRIRVMSIFGTRPEATKMAPVVNALAREERIESVVCVTGQHRQMLDQMLRVLHIKPDYDLDIMQEGQTLTDITTRALIGIGKVIEDIKPELCLVHGDTSTTFAGSLAAFYAGVTVGHVEAGLRTYNKREPFPEEINRLMTGDLADLHFAPIRTAKENLLKENKRRESIFVTGNTAIDLVAMTIRDGYKFSDEKLNGIDYAGKKIIAMTAHRRENLGEPLRNICRAVLRLVNEDESVEVVYAVHYNPLVQNTAREILGNHPRIHLTDPLDVLDLHNLMKRSYMVMSDSGGLQEEVPSMNKPVLVLRNVTERPEGIETGALRLAGVDEEQIYQNAKEILYDKQVYAAMAAAKNPFGDGHAAERIVRAILYYYGLESVRPEDYV